MENNLVFEEDKHQYSLGGVMLPSVTQVLTGVGIIDFSNVPPAVLEAACKFGTAAHKATALYDKRTLDEETLDPNLRPYLDGWILFRQEYGFTPTVIEQPMYSKIYHFAGTPDRLGNWRIDNSLIVPDIKTGSQFYPANPIQLAAYEILIRETAPWPQVNKGLKIKRLSILLNDKGTYKIKEYSDKRDKDIFICALSLYNWRIKHGKSSD